MLVFGCPTPFDSTKLIYFANTSHKADSPTGVLREGDEARRRAATVRSTVLAPCPLQIQRQQLLQNLLIIQITLPPIRGKDSLIEPFVRQLQPRGMMDGVRESEGIK